MFDIREMRELIMTAAWEAGSRNVGIYDRFLTGEDNEPTFFITTPTLSLKQEVYDIFMEVLLAGVADDCVCHAVVMPRVSLTRSGVTPLVLNGEWVYG